MHGKKYSWHETTALVLLGPTFLPWSILPEAVDELPNDTLSGRIGKVKEEEVRGERTEETNASTLVRVTSHVTISPKFHCEQTQM